MTQGVLLNLWLLLKAVHLLAFAVWTAVGLGAYLVTQASCNNDALARYRYVARLQALALAALGVTGFLMAGLLGFPSWAKAAGLVYLPLIILEAVHLSATRNCRLLQKRVKYLTPAWSLLLTALLYLKLYKPTLSI